MRPKICGLDEFNLDEAALRRLGNRICLVSVRLKAHHVTTAIAARAPRDRMAYLRRRAERWIAGVRRRFPHRVFDVQDVVREVPSTLSAQVSAREIAVLAELPWVESVSVRRIRGRRARRTSAPRDEWFCVRARVAIQVEELAHGMQAIEDRFVLVRALSAEDAVRRLRPEWKRYAAPYLNGDGQLVRWQLERIVDVYEMHETEIDPAGTEVYSSLAERRLRPEHVWRPARRRRVRR